MTGHRAIRAEEALDSFDVPSAPGNERLAIARVREVVGDRLAGRQLDRLETAVGEAVMNGIEHGNRNRPEIPVHIEVLGSATGVVVGVTDQGGAQSTGDRELPDLQAKLAGRQSPRGWGLFLIEQMVDAMELSVDGANHTVWLTVHGGATTPEGG